MGRFTWSELAFPAVFRYFLLVDRHLIIQGGPDLRGLEPALGFEALEVTP
ncbi:MAG: hypothetical protein JSV78_15110 [Phycisphaerales bacterium]|nr:MAG: hypothetical protein JSV78_15110 [Phycisphaerales bacterium]